ncbi:MAG: protein kinase, partial [Planctomycetota bacterium]|nr:protein kinase [Planctomycetota bacterium]
MSSSHSQSQIGPYLLDEEIGRGGMGLVYRAVHQRSGQNVAIKLLLQPGQESHSRALLDEAITGKKLDHQNCLKSYEVLAYGPTQSPVIVSEYIDGMNLRDFLDSLHSDEPQFRFSPLNATLILEQLFLGLRAAHKAGLIHQDIKPEN